MGGGEGGGGGGGVEAGGGWGGHHVAGAQHRLLVYLDVKPGVPGAEGVELLGPVEKELEVQEEEVGVEVEVEEQEVPRVPNYWDLWLALLFLLSRASRWLSECTEGRAGAVARCRGRQGAAPARPRRATSLLSAILLRYYCLRISWLITKPVPPSRPKRNTYDRTSRHGGCGSPVLAPPAGERCHWPSTAT